MCRRSLTLYTQNDYNFSQVTTHRGDDDSDGGNNEKFLQRQTNETLLLTIKRHHHRRFTSALRLFNVTVADSTSIPLWSCVSERARKPYHTLRTVRIFWYFICFSIVQIRYARDRLYHFECHIQFFFIASNALRTSRTISTSARHRWKTLHSRRKQRRRRRPIYWFCVIIWIW